MQETVIDFMNSRFHNISMHLIVDTSYIGHRWLKSIGRKIKLDLSAAVFYLQT